MDFNPLSGIVKAVSRYAERREETKARKVEAIAHVDEVKTMAQVAKSAGEVKVTIELAKLDALIQKSKDKQLDGTWKDEFSTVIASLFVIGAFVAGMLYPWMPELVVGVERGIDALSHLSGTDYGKAFALILLAAAGITKLNQFLKR